MNIHSIETGFFSTDGGVMFGIVSRKVWAALYPVDESNRCPLAMRVLFVDMGDHKVLFDTGVGMNIGKSAGYYRFHDLKNLTESLNNNGYQAEDITDVVFSHLHFDHCGGSVHENSQGKLVPTFPNATYWCSEGQWKIAQNPSVWESESYVPNVVKVLLDAGKLCLLNSDRFLFPGLRVKLVQGHTDDQLVSYIDTSEGVLVYVGDVIPMTPHITPLCIAAGDNSAVLSVDEKIKILEEAVEKDQILFFFHDIKTKAARLKKTNGRISLKEKILL